MIINTREIKALSLIVAKGKFKNATFARRDLMLAVEDAARQLGLWPDEDDIFSSSKGEKSKGLAKIDWAISALKDKGLTNVGHDQWRITTQSK